MANDTMTPIRQTMRVFNKDVLNPLMMIMAGRKHAEGRTSVMLGGESFDVVDPEIIGAAKTLPQLTARSRRFGSPVIGPVAAAKAIRLQGD